MEKIILDEATFFHILVTFNIDNWDLWIKACYDIGGVYTTEDDEVDTFEEYKALCGTAEDEITGLRFLSNHNNTVLSEPVKTFEKEVAFRNNPSAVSDLKKLVDILSAYNEDYNDAIFSWKFFKLFESFIYPDEKYEIGWSEIYEQQA